MELWNRIASRDWLAFPNCEVTSNARMTVIKSFKSPSTYQQMPKNKLLIAIMMAIAVMAAPLWISVVIE